MKIDVTVRSFDKRKKLYLEFSLMQGLRNWILVAPSGLQPRILLPSGD